MDKELIQEKEELNMTEETQEFQSLSLADESTASVLRNLSDEMLMNLSFPVNMGSGQSYSYKDADGFPTINQSYLWDLHEWQEECWRKVENNPQISSHVRDIMGRMTGWGFEIKSSVKDIHRAIEEIMEDPRNDLYQNFPDYVARAEGEGELFLILTLHKNGFVEVDFTPPSSVRAGGDSGSGIIFHPTKKQFPLFYHVMVDTHLKNIEREDKEVLIPSINLAYYPELEKEVKDHESYSTKKVRFSKARQPKAAPYKDFNGYKRFMIHWNKGYMVKRNISHIKTTIQWVNYYEDLKKYEIDHKKSSGAYLWVITMENAGAFRQWLNMSEEQRKQTGIMQPKDPGGTLVLPPGMELQVQNPKLNNISDQDNDIMQMVSSGLQKPQDTMLGDYRSTYASVKASQGPQGDRINDELHYFKMFLMYSFLRPILWLRSKAKSDFKYMRKVQEVTGFEKGDPQHETVQQPCYKLVDIDLPVSRLEDIEATATALLGSKHGSVVDTLGIDRKSVAKRLGFGGYEYHRMEKAREDENLPETLSALNQEQAQEEAEGEQPKAKSKSKSKQE